MDKSSIAERQPASSDQRHASDDFTVDNSTTSDIEAHARLVERRRNLLLRQHLVLKFLNSPPLRFFLPPPIQAGIIELVAEFRAIDRIECAALRVRLDERARAA